MDDKLLELHNLSGKVIMSQNTSTSSQDDDFMVEFNQKIKLSQESLNRLAENNQKLQKTLEIYFNSQEDLSEQLQQIMMWNQKQHIQMKEIMNNLTQDVKASQQEQVNEPETQWKINQLNALKTKAQDLAKSNLFLYIKYKTGLNDKLILCQDSEQVKEIEKRLQFIESYIDQLALLLEIQVIDNIEINLMNAKNYIIQGDCNLNHVRQVRSTWKKKCLLVLGIFVMIILLLQLIY